MSRDQMASTIFGKAGGAQLGRQASRRGARDHALRSELTPTADVADAYTLALDTGSSPARAVRGAAPRRGSPAASSTPDDDRRRRRAPARPIAPSTTAASRAPPRALEARDQAARPAARAAAVCSARHRPRRRARRRRRGLRGRRRRRAARPARSSGGCAAASGATRRRRPAPRRRSLVRQGFGRRDRTASTLGPAVDTADSALRDGACRPDSRRLTIRRCIPNEIRASFLKYFETHGHRIVAELARSCPATTRRCSSPTPG